MIPVRRFDGLSGFGICDSQHLEPPSMMFKPKECQVRTSFTTCGVRELTSVQVTLTVAESVETGKVSLVGSTLCLELKDSVASKTISPRQLDPGITLIPKVCTKVVVIVGVTVKVPPLAGST